MLLATSADLPECADLIAAIPFFDPYFDREQILRAMQGRPESQRILLDREDGMQRGLCWFDPRGHLSRSGYLRLLAVHPAAQGRGVAARLLQAAEEQVFAVSSALYLMVNTQNHPARAFYLRHGYRELGVLPGYAVPGQDEVLMVRQRERGEACSSSGFPSDA